MAACAEGMPPISPKPFTHLIKVPPPLLSIICCAQGLRRLILFGFQSDAKSLQVVPAVAQVRYFR